jgi:DNA-binding MarR family transcriptional regulator
MEDKNELVSDVLTTLRRIIDKHTLVDEMPMTFERDVVLTPREIRTIDLIGNRTETNVTDVGNHFRFTKSAASQLVTRLVKRGLVEKDRSPHNSKEYLLSLTSEGIRAQQVYQKFHAAHVDDLRQRLSAFSVQQVATTSVLLEVVESVVDERLKSLG